MAFIDNSGNIILDAVLTDLGREALARGDGSFRIAGFGLGDDEIDYADWDANAASSTAGATIKQTPVFEAITKNTAALKHRLITVIRNDLLYLPVIKINELDTSSKRTSIGNYLVGVDKDTKDILFSGGASDGVLDGFTPLEQSAHIRLDQGLDTTEVSYEEALDSSKLTYESTYEIQIDNRFASVVDMNGEIADPSQIDENNVAYYQINVMESNNFVQEINNTTDSAQMTIAGPRGTMLKFKLRASTLLQTSTALFTKLGQQQLGSAIGAPSSATSTTFNTLDTVIKITGVDTGYQVDIPVKFAKKV